MRSVILILFLLFVSSCNFSDFIKDLSGSYKYYNEGESFKVIYGGSKNQNVIPCTVVKYGYTSNFIVALQKATNNCQFPNKVKQEIGKSYYWIIDVKEDSLYRFSSRTEYIKKREELGVPKKLQFE